MERSGSRVHCFLGLLQMQKVNELYLRARLLHLETHFSAFAFDIIALLKDTYRPYALSSMTAVVHQIGKRQCRQYNICKSGRC
jgi:hypothetical protein